MSRTFTDESTLTTLCPRCLNAFRNTRGIRVRRADPFKNSPKSLAPTARQTSATTTTSSPPARKPPPLRKDALTMNPNVLKTDPEFQSKIPPLTFEELNQLEANILRDGRILNPIIVWEGLIVDGHNRYTIAKKHPEIPFTIHEKEFASRYEAIIWICKNQLGRRNLTPEQKKYLIGKQYEAEKMKLGGDHGNSRSSNGTFSPNSQNGDLGNSRTTCKKIAAENGISKNTVLRAEQFSKGMVDRGWRDGDYVLTDEDYVGVDFKTTGEHELSEKKMLDVLLVKPNEHPRNVSIGAELEDLQQAVGGSIGASYPFADDPVAIVYNDDGKLMGLPLNRALRDGEVGGEDVRCRCRDLSGGGAGREGFRIPDPGTGAEVRAAFSSAGSLSEVGQSSAGAVGARRTSDRKALHQASGRA